MNFQTPSGMSRRHFAKHLAGLSAFAGTSLALGKSLSANTSSLLKNKKSAILLWMGGGPSTIDLWDLKPNSEMVVNSSQSIPGATCKSASICR